MIVYATFSSGTCKNHDDSGDLVVSSDTITGLIERKLRYHVYNQGAWSFNSENMNVPITPGITGSIGAKLVGPAVISGNYSASVEIVGYART